MLHHRSRPPWVFGAVALIAVCLPALGFAVLGKGRDLAASRTFGPTTDAYLGGRLPREAPVLSGGWKAVPAFPNLKFQDPTNLVPEPGGRRLCVTGRQGLIEAFENDPNTSTKTTVLDLRARCQGWDDCGLMGLAFHPEFAKPGSPNRGYLYVFYNYTDSPHRGPGRPETRMVTSNRLSRFTVPDGSDVADPASETVLIDQLDRCVWHNGGGMFFHPADGFLYLSLGDEGADYTQCQRINHALFGGVIRIDVDRRGGGISHPIINHPRDGISTGYYIPNDNPWV
ncbi:MAG: PQQ-dependent sugar dehydrogenase, partial [Parafilimonas terrae]|nr:PQQ-dependent sugar dehydrogenase [Parafilimonas terrae]